MRSFSLASVFILTLSCAGVALAQDAHEKENEHEEQHYSNEFAVVVANTHEAQDGVNLFTIGVEYERWLHERVGVVGEFEFLPSADAWVFVAPVVVKVWGEFELFGGPGIEHIARRESREVEEHGHEPVVEESGADNLFLFRAGAGYHVRLGDRLFMVPHVAVDFINEKEEVARAIVYGVVVGFGF